MSTLKEHPCLDGTTRITKTLPKVPPDYDLQVSGKVVSGYGICSGRATDSPYPAGSLALQYPHFKKLGLDLGHCFPGSLNVSIAPNTFEILTPKYRFDQVRWCEEHPPENFLFAECWIEGAEAIVEGYIYYPDPETKRKHFVEPTVIEIIAPYLASSDSGVSITLHFSQNALSISRPLI